MKLKKWIKYIIIIFIVISLIGGVIIYISNKNKKEVHVYSAEELSTEDYWANDLSSSGSIKEDKIQSVYLNSTQQIEKIVVKEGQNVKKGDVLLKYNTTLTNIEIEGKQIAINKLEIDLNKAQKELEEIKKYQPGVPIYGSIQQESPQVEETLKKHTELPKLTKPEPEVEASKEIKPAPLTGNGTASLPYLFIWEENKEYDKVFIESLLNRVSSSCKEVIAVFMIRENNAITGNLLKLSKIKFTKTDDIIPEYNFSILDTSTEVDPLYPNEQIEVPAEQEEVNEPEVGPIYSANEIQKMLAEKQKEIDDINLNIKIAKKEYNKLKNELGNTTVTSRVDGVVKKVLDKDDPEINNKPVVVVSGGGGYYLEGRIGEYDLFNIKVGQKVNVQSYETGTTAEGTIESISNYPIENDMYSYGNQNVSYYPYTVRIGEDATFKDSEYIEISIVQDETVQSNTFYLPQMFILSENGKNYAYVADSDDKLEKKEVVTGKNRNGIIEIYSGIEKSDRIAFPYGKTVKEGAKVTDTSVEELYESY